MDSTMRGGCISGLAQGIFVDPSALQGLERFDAEKITSFLKRNQPLVPSKFSLSALRKLPFFLRRKSPFKLILTQEETSLKVTDVVERERSILGCAIDLGSTTIAFYLYDFEKGEMVKEYSILNPQVAYGEDILTRLHFARKKENLAQLREITLASINQELETLGGDYIYALSICGNTAMTHFFLGLPVNYLMVEPYEPVGGWYGFFSPHELELKIHPEGVVFVFPSVGAYFGGDLVAGLYQVKLYQQEKPSFFIDVGTNAEVVLGNREFMLACAGAAGPALEGGVFKAGCRAEARAIAKIKIHPEKKRLEFETIAPGKPKCLCGSAIIDLMAQLFMAGVLSPTGRLIKENWPERIVETEDGLAFLVYQDESKVLLVKESEIRSFLRSKGAMYSILSLLCEKCGLTFSEVEKFYFAGSFGVNIKVESAVTLGMLPEEALGKAIPVGNSAGLGALRFLQDPRPEEIRSLVDSITYLELNNEPRFMQLLTGALFIPHVNLDLFPRAKKLNNKVD